jgi:hypothetical protein
MTDLQCLPLELAAEVLSYLDVDEILAIGLVSKTWQRICNDQGMSISSPHPSWG